MDRKIIDAREFVYKRSHYMCEYEGCTRRATEIAHRIANTKENLRMIQRFVRDATGIDMTDEYTKIKFLFSPHNLAASCREHNDYFNCGYNNAEVAKIIAKCLEEL